MNYLILVKHSLPEVIPSIPATQWSLSETGRSRCKRLAEKIQPYAPDIVVSSMEIKAVQTGHMLAREIKKPFQTYEGLHEHDRVGEKFLSKEQFEARVQDFFNHPTRLVMGRETAVQAGDRFLKAIASVERDYPHQNLVIVSHGTVITLFTEKVTGLEPFSFWQELDLPSFVVFSLPGYTRIKTVKNIT